jgi:hypothetical protein
MLDSSNSPIMPERGTWLQSMVMQAAPTPIGIWESGRGKPARVNDNGLLQRSNQIGSSPNRGDMVKANKLETVEKVEATKFSFALD